MTKSCLNQYQKANKEAKRKTQSRLCKAKQYRKDLKNKLLSSETKKHLYVDINWLETDQEQFKSDLKVFPLVRAALIGNCVEFLTQFKSDFKIFSLVRAALIGNYVEFFNNNPNQRELPDTSDESIYERAKRLHSCELLTPSTSFRVDNLFEGAPKNFKSWCQVNMKVGWKPNWTRIPRRVAVGTSDQSRRYMCADAKVVSSFSSKYGAEFTMMLESLKRLFFGSHHIVFKLLHSEPGDLEQRKLFTNY